MREQEAKNLITNLPGLKKPRGLSVSEIADQLKMGRSERKRLQKWLRDLVVSGSIHHIGRGRYSTGPDKDLAVGTLMVLKNGWGKLVEESGEESYYISEHDMGVALPGDKVLVRKKVNVRHRLDAEQKGVVTKIVARAKHTIVGVLRKAGRAYRVVPTIRVYRQSFEVPETRGAVPGDRVMVKFVSWSDPNTDPTGEVVEVIGPEDEASLDTLAVIKNFGIREEFSEQAYLEAGKSVIRPEDYKGREDLRNQLVITIDPDRARDFDDALSMSIDGQGRRVIGVHIADVSHFVKVGGALDSEARLRGNSFYFPDKVVPMLPEQLSNGICSLKPGEDRLAVSAFLTLDARGKVVARRFSKSVIKSFARLTYRTVMEMFKRGKGRLLAQDGVNQEVAELLWALNDAAQQLRRLRFKNSALDMDIPEHEVMVGQDGKISEIRLVESDVSHQLVEELMVAANEAVATELHAKRVPAIYRIHDAPDEDRLEDLRIKLAEMGRKCGSLQERKNMARFLESIKDDPLAYHIRVAVLRSMKRAVYSASPRDGHYGLAKRYYCHFTSPIRRYPDLVAHRQLWALLVSKKQEHFKSAKSENLEGVAQHCSMTEQNADEAERTVLEIKKYRYLENEVKSGQPLPHEAVVVSVTNFGAFIELLDIGLQGLIHISALSKGRTRFDRAKKLLRAGKDIFKVGSRVTVQAVNVDYDRRRLDFEPIYIKAES